MVILFFLLIQSSVRFGVFTPYVNGTGGLLFILLLYISVYIISHGCLVEISLFLNRGYSLSFYLLLALF